MVRPKKHLGQHFLRDDNIARKIAGMVPENSRVLLEIGPGTGVLTRFLMEKTTLDFYAMEIDPESVSYLKAHYPAFSHRIIEADFLRYDLSGFPPGDPAACFNIIGNFPYNISSQILFRVLECRQRITNVTGMFQKEVAERIAAPPGSKTYGILSVLMQAWYDIEYLFTVSETVFFPPPRVKSAVIRLTRNGTESLGCNETLFFRLVRTAFNQRRKTLRNALKSIEGFDRIRALPLLGRRAEQLTVNDFIDLAREIDTFA